MFSAPAEGQKLAFTHSTITPAVHDAWSSVPGGREADPVTIAMTRATAQGRTAGVAVFAVPPGSPLASGVRADNVVLSTKAAAALNAAPGDQGVSSP